MAKAQLKQNHKTSQEKTGALVVAWSEAEAERLPAIQVQALKNEVTNVRLLNASQLAAKQPQLSNAAIEALEIPREYIIDPWTTPFIYLLQAIKNGATLIRGAEVTAGHHDGSEWQLHTRQGVVKAGSVINYAGLYGDLLDQTLRQKSNFEIRPRKGQFLVFDKAANTNESGVDAPNRAY